jgi:hypothetical protein
MSLYLTQNNLSWLNLLLAAILYFAFAMQYTRVALVVYILLMIGLYMAASGSVAQSFYLSPPGPQGYQLADGRVQKTTYL